ncbi:MAG: ISNCY family transposase [Actinomycetota bacterium]|nr:ISNCY family transposase [Actinomycetota bacterium]
MLRTVCPQRTLWESILPEPLLQLSAELARVDALLNDEAFFEPFRAHFHATLGRPSIPMETYLRLMFLKHRYRLGYEALCREVGDSITWSRFCRIPLGTSVPHPTTLMKITTRCGEEAVACLNDALLAKAAEARVLRTNKVRADTTVVEANVAYPTDSGLLAKAIGKMSGAVDRLKGAGLAVRTAFRDRRRSSRRRAHSIAASLRRRSEESKGAAKAITGQLAGIAAKAANEAEDVVRNARRALSHKQMTSSGRLRRVLDELAVTVERTRRVVAQTRIRLSGQTPDGATRLVSLHDAHARPVRKGRLDRPTEFGYTAQVVDNADGVIVDYEVSSGNPPDAPRLAPAVARIKARTGKAPDTVAADRGYGEARVEEELGALGVKKTVIPRKGKPPSARRAHEHRPAFRRVLKWRTGAEGRISCLKRDFGWRRTRLDGIDGARTWCGHGVFTHNLVKIGALVSE